MKTVFRSRWRALWWCAGVLVTAYCTLPDSDDNAAQTSPTTQTAPQHANPWSKDAAAK
jgi:hypothetical protein